MLSGAGDALHFPSTKQTGPLGPARYRERIYRREQDPYAARVGLPRGDLVRPQKDRHARRPSRDAESNVKENSPKQLRITLL